MSKSILVFFAGKPFGVFSNKTNAWMAVTHNYKVEELCVYSDKKQEYLPASYSMLAARLGKAGKCHIFKREDVSEAALAALGDKKALPCIYVYQYETNVANDGLLYKSSDKSEAASDGPAMADKGGSDEESDKGGSTEGDEADGETNPPVPDSVPETATANVLDDHTMSHQPGDDEENAV